MRRSYRHLCLLWAVLLISVIGTGIARATVLWSHPESVLVCNNGKGEDILKGAIKPQNANSAGTLYFRILVDPIADTATKVIKGFEAGFMLVEKGEEHLGMGNSDGAMAYSALNVPKAPKGFQDLNSSVPDPPFAYEYMRAGTPRYIVFKIEYIPGRDARVTAWLNPDLSIGATEFNQPTNIVVHFEANAAFDEFRLIHRGYGSGWRFSQMMVASSFEDLLIPHFWQQKWFFPVVAAGLLVGVGGAVRLIERRRARRQIQWLEMEHAVATERTRIAQDIHDEVGTSLTKISKLTEMMNHPENDGSSQTEFTRKIARTAQDTIRSMDEIVWAINPRNDTLKEMADYLVYYLEDFLRHTGVECVLDVPIELPEATLTSEVRHNLFMAVKEALNNAVKHGGAKRIRLGMTLSEGKELSISVSDNGCGFRPGETAAVGNGLENMRRRLNTIGGRFELQSEPGRGTTVTFQISLKTGAGTRR